MPLSGDNPVDPNDLAIYKVQPSTDAFCGLHEVVEHYLFSWPIRPYDSPNSPAPGFDYHFGIYLSVHPNDQLFIEA